MPRRALNTRRNTSPIERPAGPRAPIMSEAELREAIERMAEDSGKRSLEKAREKIGREMRLALSADKPES